MDKLKMQTANKADENFKKLAAMFPNAVTETIDENGEVVRAIDKDVLMQEISCKVVDGNEERYQFTWPDKKKSVLLANAPINKTLRPCREESVDFDNTENLYIEGDNLEVLKLLQETYLGKVKMIYIDPPYNTGNDFVYADDFAQSTDEYLENSGQFDDEGNCLVKNLDTNGRFHSDWLNMIYPRLKLAKDLLTEDGVIFISIDGHELETLEFLCNEVFSKSNFLGTIVLQTATDNNPTQVNEEHEYMVCYAKNRSCLLPWYRISEAAEAIQKQYEKIKRTETNVENIQTKLREWINNNKDIRLINEQKATMIVEHISYDTIEGEYDSTIFTTEKNTQSFDKAFLAKKAIQDYVFTDGSAEKSIERKFAEDLDAAEEVCVYAKLPRTFQIPTPVGNYSPDWAIAFYEGKVKHIFFVAETKGTMESLELRPIEQAKISCAKKLFNEMSTSKVKYHDVDSYQSLLSIMNAL